MQQTEQCTAVSTLFGLISSVYHDLYHWRSNQLPQHAKPKLSLSLSIYIYIVLQGDTLVPYLFIIHLDYVLRTWIDLMKENSFIIKKAGTDNIPQKLLQIQTTQMTESYLQIHLHKSKQAAGGIGFYVNADKIEYMCFNQKGNISILNGGSLKPVDKWMYLGSSIASTENDINMELAKAWTVINRLSIICKSDLSDKIKCNFFQAVVVSILLYGGTT